MDEGGGRGAAGRGTEACLFPRFCLIFVTHLGLPVLLPALTPRMPPDSAGAASSHSQFLWVSLLVPLGGYTMSPEAGRDPLVLNSLMNLSPF